MTTRIVHKVQVSVYVALDIEDDLNAAYYQKSGDWAQDQLACRLAGDEGGVSDSCVFLVDKWGDIEKDVTAHSDPDDMLEIDYKMWLLKRGGK